LSLIDTNSYGVNPYGSIGNGIYQLWPLMFPLFIGVLTVLIFICFARKYSERFQILIPISFALLTAFFHPFLYSAILFLNNPWFNTEMFNLILISLLIGVGILTPFPLIISKLKPKRKMLYLFLCSFLSAPIILLFGFGTVLEGTSYVVFLQKVVPSPISDMLRFFVFYLYSIIFGTIMFGVLWYANKAILKVRRTFFHS